MKASGKVAIIFAATSILIAVIGVLFMALS